LPKPPAVPLTVPSEVLRQRPDIRAAERRVAAANAAIGVAQAAFYPTLTLDASAGLETGSWGDLLDASAQVWSLGPRVNVPISAAGLRVAQRDAAVAAHTEASAEYRQTVLEAMAEVENALQAASAMERQQHAQDTAAAAARKALELSRERFQQGMIGFLDVIDAERTRLESERRARAVRGGRLVVVVSLLKALGGRW
jgi:NodT family efflux transporter outer membrane factor (OMF) lipoprotein